MLHVIQFNFLVRISRCGNFLITFACSQMLDSLSKTCISYYNIIGCYKIQNNLGAWYMFKCFIFHFLKRLLVFFFPCPLFTISIKNSCLPEDTYITLLWSHKQFLDSCIGMLSSSWHWHQRKCISFSLS